MEAGCTCSLAGSRSTLRLVYGSTLRLVYGSTLRLVYALSRSIVLPLTLLYVTLRNDASAACETALHCRWTRLYKGQGIEGRGWDTSGGDADRALLGGDGVSRESCW